MFDPREDTAPEGKILAMLLQKSLVPVETKDPLGETENTQTICTASKCSLAVISNGFLIAGRELAHKLAELKQVRIYLQV